jgi:HD-like signal output (HDOD) protein
MEVANDPDAGIRELKAVMEIDAALTVRVLRSVNSSAYALRTKITNLQQAISYLGVKAIRNLALTASVSSLFRKDQNHGSYSRHGLWRHLVAVGICARLIAMRMKFSQFEDVYLAGLLHDIGIILEDQHLHAAFLKVIGGLQQGKTLSEFETCQFGFDHTMLGGEIAIAWKMPCAIIDAVRYHHGSLLYKGQYKETIRCVEVANYICSLKGIGSVGVHLSAFPRDSILGLALEKTDLVVIAEDLDREIHDNQSVFQM